MCLVCFQWNKGNLNIKDAFRNLSELIRSASTDEEKEHLLDFANELVEFEHIYGSEDH